MKLLHIEYANPDNLEDSVVLDYRLKDNPIVPKWINCVLAAQEKYSIDAPNRFYGFGDYNTQLTTALTLINKNIEIVKSYYPQLTGNYVTDVLDQDLLNYWHHQFEIYHGLLDQQKNIVPLEVLSALADLNVCVHRCESVARGAMPRHVVTYFGLPKTNFLDQSDYQYFTDIWEPGTVFVNYVEIGKTLADLTFDNDNYIAPEAFKPFEHYSADFVVRFFEHNSRQATKRRAIINKYYEKHKSFFGPWQPCFVDGNIPLATLEGPMDLKVLESRQYVKQVSFT